MSTYIKDQFDKANETLEFLGIENPFKLEDIKVSTSLQTSLKKHKAVMVITPKIDSSFTFKDLVAKHDTALGKDSYISSRYNDYTGTQEASISFVYMDGDGKAYKNEPGLYGCNKTVDQQLAQLAKLPGDVHAVNPIEYIVLFAMFRKKPLDQYTWTQFIADPIEGSRYVRYAGTWSAVPVGGVFDLGLNAGSPDARPCTGFRVARGLSLTPSALDSCSSPSSDTPGTSGDLSAIAASLQEIVDKEKKAEYDRGYEAGRASVKEALKGLIDG